MNHSHVSSPAIQARISAAQAEIDRDLLRKLLTDLVNIPSPAGQELNIASYCAEILGAAGLQTRLQCIGPEQANTVARLPGKGGVPGAELLLYANLDTHMAGEAEDGFSAGVPYPDILRPAARWDGDEISGLCAENPKGFAACVMLAGIAIARSGIELAGDLVIGLGAGGMAVLDRPGFGPGFGQIGHGIGALSMLQRMVRPDYCILCKPVFAVSWEEAGICFFKLRLKGGIAYAGIRHLLDTDPNPIPKLPRLITELEAWFPKYAQANTSGLVAPQGAISAVNGGWAGNPIISAGAIELVVDLRLSPRQTPNDAKRALAACLGEISARHPDIETELELMLAMPSAHTPPDNWIVRSLIAAWEASEQRPHEPFANFAGYTDASVIRQWGIPVARLGVPLRIRAPDAADSLPMNRLHLDDALRLVSILVHAAVDTCARPLAETRT